MIGKQIKVGGYKIVPLSVPEPYEKEIMHMILEEVRSIYPKIDDPCPCPAICKRNIDTVRDDIRRWIDSVYFAQAKYDKTLAERWNEELRNKFYWIYP